jgi:hypothetical protein
MDPDYKTKCQGASHLSRAAEEIRRNPRLLHIWAQKTAHRVFAGVLDRGESWDTLFVAAVAAGLDHLKAQRDIGMAFAAARMIVSTEGGVQ